MRFSELTYRVVKELLSRFETFKRLRDPHSVPADLFHAIFQTAARNGREEAWEFILEVFMGKEEKFVTLRQAAL